MVYLGIVMTTMVFVYGNPNRIFSIDPIPSCVVACESSNVEATDRGGFMVFAYTSYGFGQVKTYYEAVYFRLI